MTTPVTAVTTTASIPAKDISLGDIICGSGTAHEPPPIVIVVSVNKTPDLVQLEVRKQGRATRSNMRLQPTDLLVIQKHLVANALYLYGSRNAKADWKIGKLKIRGYPSGSCLIHLAGDNTWQKVATENVISRATPAVLADRYLKTNGVRCPYCNDDNIEGEPPQSYDKSYDNRFEQRISCNNCDAEWADLYSLTGFNANISPWDSPIRRPPVLEPAEENTTIVAVEEAHGWLRIFCEGKYISDTPLRNFTAEDASYALLEHFSRSNVANPADMMQQIVQEATDLFRKDQFAMYSKWGCVAIYIPNKI